MNHIVLDAHGKETTGSFLGELAQPFAYRPELRTKLDELASAAKRSDNRHFVLEGTEVRAAQSTINGAISYMNDARILVSIKGCGKSTHVDGTNGGTMPCGCNLTRFGVTEPYYCAKCEPFAL